MVQGLRNWFIKLNNWSIKATRPKFKRGNTLILASACLQNSKCKEDVVNDIKNCKECGTCPIGELRAAAEKENIEVAVASGGMMAREISEKVDPRLIIAIACAMELVGGIFAVFPTPVVAIAITRPHGPCRDTQFDIAELNARIKFLLE